MAHQKTGSLTENQFGQFIARVAELVDAPDLGFGGVTRGSSSLPFRTMMARHGLFSKRREITIEVDSIYASLS